MIVNHAAPPVAVADGPVSPDPADPVWTWPALENPDGDLDSFPLTRIPTVRFQLVEGEMGPPDPVPAPAFGDIAALRAKAANSSGVARAAALAALAFALDHRGSNLDPGDLPAYERAREAAKRSYRELLADPSFTALPTADAELYRAARVFLDGSTSNAAAGIAAFEQLIARYPSSPLVSAAHLQLAKELGYRDRAAALQHYAAALEHGDAMVREDARLDRALLYEQSGDHEHALDELVMLMHSGAKDMRYFAAEAAIDPYLALRSGGDAFAFFASADPDDIVGLVGDLGVDYVEHDRFDDAIGLLREVVKRDSAAGKHCQYRSALIRALAAKDARAELVAQTTALAANHLCDSLLGNELGELAWHWAQTMPPTTEGRRDLLALWELATARQTGVRQLIMIRDRAILAWRVALADATRSAWAIAASASITATVAGDLGFLGPAIDADGRAKRR